MTVMDSDGQVRRVLNERNLKFAQFFAQVVIGPLIVAGLIYAGGAIVSIDRKVTAIEQQLRDKLPDIYPRSEAIQALKWRDGRDDELEHRIGNLEAARQPRLQ